MILPLFLGLIVFMGGASLWLSKAPSNSKTSDDYFLMGRKLGLFGLTMTLLATQIGGGALLGAAEEAYLWGWKVLFYPAGMVVGLLILGLGYGAKMRKLDLTTVPEIFEKIYDSLLLRKIASLLSIASIFLILIAQAIAAHKYFISLGFHGDLLFVGFWSVLIIYTAKGGLKAAVKTDILQVIFIILTLFAALFFAKVSPQAAQIAPTEITVKTPWLSWLLLPLLFMLIEQDMGQWCFAAKNPRTVSLGALIAAVVFMAVAFVPIFFGISASTQGLVVENGSSVFLTSVAAFTNSYLATCVTCAVLMAIISTANALLCSVSANLVCDFSLTKSFNISRLMTFGVGAFTLVFGFLFDNVVSVLMFAYELAVSVLFVPVTMAIWTKSPHKKSAALSMICGGTCFLVLKLFTIPIPKELISLSVSFTAFWVNEWYEKKADVSCRNS